jgi:cardiolipin synthase
VVPSTRTLEELTPAPRAAPGTGRAVFDVRLGRSEVASRFGGAALDRRLDHDTGSVARRGNATQLLFDGVNSFAERGRLIASAKTSIHLQTFIFTDDETGWALARQLIAKAKEGVAVRVIVDGLGSNRSDEAIFEAMRKGGVEVRARETGLDPTELNHRWHEKHLIVDGRVAITGGMNIADEYALGGSGRQVISRGANATEPWRDVDVRIEGSAVEDEQRSFLRNWGLLGKPAPVDATLFPRSPLVVGASEVRVVQQHSAGEPPDDHVLKLYLHTIAAARESITIENAYFVPPPELREALADAARRGVRVRVLTNSKESSDMGFVVDAARYFYDDLLKAGVEIWEKRGGTLHAKTASFDGQFSIVGSYNLNGRSAGCDTECAVAIRDDATAAKLDERFDDGVTHAEKITAATVAKDSFVDDVRQWMASTVSWTI